MYLGVYVVGGSCKLYGPISHDWAVETQFRLRRRLLHDAHRDMPAVRSFLVDDIEQANGVLAAMNVADIEASVTEFDGSDMTAPIRDLERQLKLPLQFTPDRVSHWMTEHEIHELACDVLSDQPALVLRDVVLTAARDSLALALEAFGLPVNAEDVEVEDWGTDGFRFLISSDVMNDVPQTVCAARWRIKSTIEARQAS